MTSLHFCEAIFPHKPYGNVMTYCEEDKKGRFWIGEGGGKSQVNFCPCCGQKARILATPFRSKQQFKLASK